MFPSLTFIIIHYKNPQDVTILCSFYYCKRLHMSFLNENNYQLPTTGLNGKFFRNLPDHFQKLPLKNNYHILPFDLQIFPKNLFSIF